MDITPFKKDIDELLEDFTKDNATTLAEMKRVWLSRKFSFIYEAKPSRNLGFFMQALYAHAIGHMISTSSLSQRLAGLYCLYCLYETQPFNPPFKIYLSLGELKKLKTLVVDAKQNGITVVPALIKRMLDKNMFLFGFVDTSDRSVTERVNETLMKQDALVQVAYTKLFSNTRIEEHVHMDLGLELGLEGLKKVSSEYARAKEEAIREAGKVVDVGDIKHIIEDERLVGDGLEKIADGWNIQKEAFYKQVGMECPSRKGGVDDFGTELEYLLNE